MENVTLIVVLFSRVLSKYNSPQGRTVLVRTKNEGMYDGIFCTLSPKAAFVLKCVHKLEKKTANGVNGVNRAQCEYLQF